MPDSDPIKIDRDLDDILISYISFWLMCLCFVSGVPHFANMRPQRHWVVFSLNVGSSMPDIVQNFH